MESVYSWQHAELRTCAVINCTPCGPYLTGWLMDVFILGLARTDSDHVAMRKGKKEAADLLMLYQVWTDRPLVPDVPFRNLDWAAFRLACKHFLVVLALGLISMWAALSWWPK